MERYCRVCMAENPAELISLFQIHDNEEEVIANMIIDCTEVMVSDDDNLPQQICGKCLIRLNHAYELRKQCQKSDEAFRAMLMTGASFPNETQQNTTYSADDQKIETLQPNRVDDADDKSEKELITSDPWYGTPSIEDEDMTEAQSVEYLDEDEDYHEYVGSTTKIKTEATTEDKRDHKVRIGTIPEPEFVNKMEEFDHYIVYQVCGERCCGCHMIFPDIDSLSNHCQQDHNNEQISTVRSKLECDTCFKRMESIQLLRKHKQAVQNNVLYYCKLCSSVLEDELSFLKHILMMEDHDVVVDTITLVDKFEEQLSKGSVCCGCEIICRDESDLKKHIAETHFSNTKSVEHDGDLECRKCFKRFQQQEELLRHQSEAQLRLYHCRIGDCTYSTIHKRHIIKHITTNNSHRNSPGKPAKPMKKDQKVIEDDGRFCCCFVRCHEMFDVYEDLENHAETVHELLRIQHRQDREHTQVVCEICLKGFENEQAFDRHRSSDKNRKHVCGTCGAKYVSKSTLVQHERSNCGKVAQYQCSECDKTFMSLGGFRNHQEVHSAKRSHVCDICGRGFLRKGILKDHMNTVHSKARLFQCTLCSKSFTSRNVFQSHQMTHTKEKPYQCRHCEKRYYKTSDRTMHENQVHLGIRPFKCGFCPASFIRNRERRLHERTHTKAKLYNCDQCYEGYNKFSEYKAHRFEEHGLDTLRDLGPVAMAAVHGEQEQPGTHQTTECKLEIEVCDMAE
nr:zinc finger protein 14-like [Aedes albopictus]